MSSSSSAMMRSLPRSRSPTGAFRTPMLSLSNSDRVPSPHQIFKRRSGPGRLSGGPYQGGSVIALALSAALAAAPPPLVVKAARLFDGRSDKITAPALVVIQGDGIAAAGPEGAMPQGPQAAGPG